MMNNGGRGGHDDDDFGERPDRDRSRRPRRGGAREFGSDFGSDAPTPGYGDRGDGGFGRDNEGGYRGGGGGFQDRQPAEVGPRQNGTLKFFNADRGFGFISPEDGSKDVFVHISAIERSGLPQLAEGTRISFETQQDRRGRGPQAVNLQLLDDEA
ncbi:hypothetical protein CKO32_11875 [Afifella marina DSM 2698]|uniref:cold-shock protein n=1 Tax=Afifella marina TaxID=1080 RepID=UPI001DCF485E|nr:cold-shock protein [Afifella marina]MBK1624268.1 hypothetical protein [Afifella marina DSM 2698]